MRITHITAVAATLLIALLLCPVFPLRSDNEERELAYSLGDHDQIARSAAVQRLLSSGRLKVPLLLSWTRETPPHPARLFLFEHMLHLSMSEVFGQLKTVAAIPFLMRNLNIQELVPFDSWNYGAERVASDYPAAGALIKIGPEAARAVIQSLPGLNTPEDRLVAVFVVSQIEGVPEAEEFLRRLPATTGPDALITYWATTGRKSHIQRQ